MNKRTVLIVDDSDVNRKILTNLLKSDYEIIEAANGEEAIRAIQSNYKHLSAVLLDLIMPVMDGFEVLKKVSNDSVLSQIPIIITTGSDDNETEINALSYGALDYVTKPFNPQIIKRRLNNVINLRETAMTVNALRRDKLTGLYTREHFIKLATELIQTREPETFVLEYLDIDNFKFINDQYGNDVGDSVLKVVGDIFSSSFDNKDCICCRISADYFALIYPAEYIKSGQIDKIMCNASMLDGLMSSVSISEGRYIIEDISLPVSTMLDRAGIAQSIVKGRYDEKVSVFSKEMLKKITEEQFVLNEMKPALEGGQFVPWFQPQYDHSSGKLVGAEALARWIHPIEGIISPIRFIPVFEHNGFIYELDKCIWRETCRYLRMWIDEGINVPPVSVNVSRYDIYKDDLIDVILGFVEDYDIPKELLRLEITESAFSDSKTTVIDVVKLLIDRGFTIEIDDFGSGYSSLNTLKDVPAQILKLDMKFLRNTKSDDKISSRGGNIIESVVRMARWIDMDVIAEGVETAEQADYLESVGCDIIQGYLYSKPVPADEFRNVLNNTTIERELPNIEKYFGESDLWNSDSLDSLLFNYFVGAACVLEYQNDRVEMLRANNLCIEMFGGINADSENILAINWKLHMSEDSIRQLKSAIIESSKTKNAVNRQIEFYDIPGCSGRKYIRSLIRVVAYIGDRYLVYCINEENTIDREQINRAQATTNVFKKFITKLHNGQAIAIYTELSMKYFYCNSKMLELFGYTEDDLARGVADEVGDLIVSGDRERIHRVIKLLENDGDTVYVDFRTKNKAGEIINVSGECMLFNGLDNETPFYIVTLSMSEKEQYVGGTNCDR